MVETEDATLETPWDVQQLKKHPLPGKIYQCSH